MLLSGSGPSCLRPFKEGPLRCPLKGALLGIQVLGICLFSCKQVELESLFGALSGNKGLRQGDVGPLWRTVPEGVYWIGTWPEQTTNIMAAYS